MDPYIWLSLYFVIFCTTKAISMLFAGTFVNVITVLLGGSIGLVIGNRVPQRFNTIIFQAIGLFTLFLGVLMALKAEALLVVVFSLVVGSVIGVWLNLDKRVEGLSQIFKGFFKGSNDRFTEGFVTSFLLFCMGSMTVLGSIEEGLGRGSQLLMTKAVMDGFSAMLFAQALGAGVLFSVVPLLLYQGGITLLAAYIGEFLPPYVVNDLAATGGILLLGLGFSILDIKNIRVMNMLPAIAVALFFSFLYHHFVNL